MHLMLLPPSFIVAAVAIAVDVVAVALFAAVVAAGAAVFC